MSWLMNQFISPASQPAVAKIVLVAAAAKEWVRVQSLDHDRLAAKIVMMILARLMHEKLII